MAVRARLAVPREAPQDWPWHTALVGSLPAFLLMSGDRRMEAENFLASGYGIKISIEAREGWQALADMASVWQPSRLKGIQVSEEFGTPFLAASQLFDFRPVVRKWLSLDRTSGAKDRFVAHGTILVTCSGNVGRATLAQERQAGVLISHDLLRVNVYEAGYRGWLYSYLRAPKVRAMMSAAQYGHIIKHLEIGHLSRLPMPVLSAEHRQCFEEPVSELLALRDRALTLIHEAEARYERAVGSLPAGDSGEAGFDVSSTGLTGRRRRLEAAVHAPNIRALKAHLARGRAVETLSALGCSVWMPTRFKRVEAPDGVELVGSSDLFEINPDAGRRIADGDFGDEYEGRVQEGWLLVARSGQVYGINGCVAIATDLHEGKVVSDDVIRVVPGLRIRAGYLHVALSHPTLGRPLLKSLIYGSSIPHLEVADLREVGVARLSEDEEDAIADLAEEAVRRLARANELENSCGDAADRVIEQFLAGEPLTAIPEAPVAFTALHSDESRRLRQRLRAMGALPVGWLDEASESGPPTVNLPAVQQAVQRLMKQLGLAVPALFATGDGGVQAIWRSESTTLKILFIPQPRTIVAISIDLEAGISIRSPDAVHLADLHDWIRGHWAAT